MSDKEESVSALFEQSEQIISDYDAGKCDNERLKQTVETLDKLQTMIRELDLFSSNEEFTELSSSSLRYLLVPAYLGYALENQNDLDNRSNYLKAAKFYFRHFLERLLSYNVIAFKLDWIAEDGEMIPESDEPVIFPKKDYAVERERKIGRLKAEKELANALKKLQIEKRRNSDEATMRETVVVQLRLWALKAVNELQMIDEELPLLAYRQKVQSGEVKNQRPQPPLVKLPPFVIAKNEEQRKVFGLGYPSLPTYTVDQWYDGMVKSGKFGNIENLNVQRIDTVDDNEIVAVPKDEDDSEEARQKAINWDEWKDLHRRGEGLKMSGRTSPEVGEIIDRDISPSINAGPPPSGRSNANLWRDLLFEQDLEDHMKIGSNISDKICTNRATETYELPLFEEMDPEEIAKRQEYINESLRKVKEQDDDLFNPAEDMDAETYGTNYRRFKRRMVPSDRVPIASADLERYKKLNAGFKRPRYNADNANTSNPSLKSYDVNSEDNSRSNSREGSFRKRKRNRNRNANEKNSNTGSKDSVISSNKSTDSVNTIETTKSRTEGLPIPVSLLKEGFDFDQFQETVLNENLEPEVFGQQLADALGEINPELICFAVKTIGVMAANRIFKKTKAVEKQGGMHVDNKSRRRTPGGVYIKLLRSDKLIPDNLRDKVRNYGASLFSKNNVSKKQKKDAMKIEDQEIPSAADVFILNSETKIGS